MGACSATCGMGEMTRVRTVNVAPIGGGAECGPQEEKQACGMDNLACDLDCETKWDDWGECSVSCGGGQRTRERIVLQQQAGTGKSCPDDMTEEENCNLQKCANVILRDDFDVWNRKVWGKETKSWNAVNGALVMWNKNRNKTKFLGAKTVHDRITKLSVEYKVDGLGCTDGYLVLSKSDNERPKKLNKKKNGRFLISWSCDKLRFWGQSNGRGQDCEMDQLSPYTIDVTITATKVTITDNRCSPMIANDDIGSSDLYVYVGASSGGRFDWIEIEGVQEEV